MEIDDLRVRVEKVTDAEADARVALARDVFELDDSVVEDDLRWGARVSVGLDRLVEDFGLDSMAYYHRGLDGETHERVGAGMILGASLLTARGMPAAGEYELRTSLAMLIMDRLGAGGSFTELQALELPRRRRGDGSRRPGPPGHQRRAARCCAGSASITASAAGACRSSSTCSTGRSRCSASGRSGTAATASSPPRARSSPARCCTIGNTTSRVDFGCHPGEWTDAWSVSGVGHHWALGTGRQVTALRAVADLLGLETVVVDRAPSTRGGRHDRARTAAPVHRAAAGDEVVRRGERAGRRLDHAARRARRTRCSARTAPASRRW